MLPKLYLFRAYQINYTNLTPALAFNTAGDNCYIPTTWAIDQKFIFMPVEDQACDKITDMANLDGSELNMVTVKLRNEFRYIKWSQNTQLLDNLLESAVKENKFQILSTSVDSEVEFIKNYLGNDVITIGTYYEDDDKSMLLRNIAENHVYSMRNGTIEPQPHDLSYLTLSDNELASHYFDEFKKIDLLPKSTTLNSYDFNLSVKDYMNRQKMLDLYSDIGLPLTAQTIEFYDTWLSNH